MSALAPLSLEQLILDGAHLLEVGDLAGAETALRKSLRLAPEEPAVWTNLGVLLATLKRETDAEQCYRVAMRLAPDYRRVRFNLAYLLMRQGRLEEGWTCLEARDSYAQVERLLSFPRWQGESLAGTRLLIGVEAGHGDMIQYCRYASLVKTSGAAQVGLICHPALKSLLSGFSAVDQLFSADQPLPSSGWDYWVPLLSLPFLFGTRLESIPAELPYLAADAARVEHWRAVMGERQGELRVGLVWRGNPLFENNVQRSLSSPALLAPLTEIPGTRFYLLQKREPGDVAEALPGPNPVIDFGAAIVDFEDTAAIMSQLDLVITVDTAAAHLAGALAKPCWVLLSDYRPDWRWLTDRADSPWYPGVMTLFRQPRAGDWGSVVLELQRRLRELRA
jgi:hypothetical protein